MDKLHNIDVNNSNNNVNIEEKKSLIDNLKDYKEVIGGLAMLAAAVLWIIGYFATKQQLKEVHCLMNANINLMQGTLEKSSFEQMLASNAEQQYTINVKAQPSSEEKVKINRLKDAAAELARKILEADSSKTKALNRLTSGECSGSLNLQP